MKGMFVMIDGLDCSGKGVATGALREWAESKGKKILDLREYWKENEGFPDFEGYDVIISAEPTFTGTGKRIRENLIKNGTDATADDIAQAYAKDRKELYEKIIIPARMQGKMIFQERGAITSFVYQPMMGDSSVDLDYVLSLEGNMLALDNAPDLLVITVIEPETAFERLAERKKQDDAIFEKLDFQKKVSAVYTSNWLRDLFESRGTKVEYLDTNYPKTAEDTKKEIVRIVERSMGSC